MIIKLFSTQGEEGDLKKSVLFNTKKNLLLLFFLGGWGVETQTARNCFFFSRYKSAWLLSNHMQILTFVILKIKVPQPYQLEIPPRPGVTVSPISPLSPI